MQSTDWQKSSYSGDGSNCIYVTTSAPGTILLRESDDPEVVLTTTPHRLRALIHALKPRTQQPANG